VCDFAPCKPKNKTNGKEERRNKKEQKYQSYHSSSRGRIDLLSLTKKIKQTEKKKGEIKKNKNK